MFESAVFNQTIRDGTASDIRESVQAILPTVTMEEAGERFAQADTDVMVVVSENDEPMGLLYHSRINEVFGMRLGRELFERRSVAQFMDVDFYCFDRTTPLTIVARQMSGLSENPYLKQHFVITDSQRLIGIGTSRKLLHWLNETRVHQAIYSNPLTLLPGQVPLAERQAELKCMKIPFSLVYFDLDNFKIFNDQYGHRRGDEALLLMAQILRRHLDNQTELFHIGGDDFEAVRLGGSVKEWASQIKGEFEAAAVELYDGNHKEQGFIEGHDRYGQYRQLPLMTLSVAIIGQHYSNADEQIVASTLVKAKQDAKKTGQVIYYSGEDPVL